MAKVVITGRVLPSQKESIQVLSETEGVTVGHLLEMALEFYIPSGVSAREWQVKRLQKETISLKQNREREHERIEEHYVPAIERIEGRLKILRSLDKDRGAKIKELIPRWILCHDLDCRRADPGKIVNRRTSKHPLELIEWFKPFGIDINWSEFQPIFMAWKGEKVCHS